MYFSANGFSSDCEQRLQDKGIITVDLNTWGYFNFCEIVLTYADTWYPCRHDQR